MDELAKYNKERWEELSRAGVLFARPFLDLTPEKARAIVDPHGIIPTIAGQDVLCLAGGGGQQSAAFALLGANVTVLDLAEAQLARDREAAQHYGFQISTHQGDMRDLSRFAADSFDIVWHAHSINFVPDTRPVFEEVTRVLRPGGLYHFSCHNPFTQGVDDARWNGEGYQLHLIYQDGEIIPEELFTNPDWDVEDEQGAVRTIKGPREFRHTLSTIFNGLAGRGFCLLGFWEDTGTSTGFWEKPAEPPRPGSWEHYMQVVAPYLNMWFRYQP